MLCLGSLSVCAEQRFPPPEFVETNHQLPATAVPGARAQWIEYLDLALMASALGLASWLSLKRRSRRGLMALSLASLVYFGFVREGCLCAIGSVQNVALALAYRFYSLSAVGLGFFLLPLVTALFWGRAFCAAVCPHGALQDWVLFRPVKVPDWLERPLGLLPYIYLGVGALLAATGSTFVICRYDPFVPLFRLSGSLLMMGVGGLFLVLSMFVGRPFCRYACPYGALLKLAATVSRWRVRVTPDACVQCRLCEASCPFGAMRGPSSGQAAAADLKTERRRLAGLLLLLPVLVLGLGWAVSRMTPALATVHPQVELAALWQRQQSAPVAFAPQSPEALALARAEADPPALLAEARRIEGRFAAGGWWLGGWIGLVIGATLISLSVRRQRTDFEPDRGGCVSCGRCFDFCPNERVRLGQLPAGVVRDFAAGKLTASGLAQAVRSSGGQAVEPPSKPS